MINIMVEILLKRDAISIMAEMLLKGGCVYNSKNAKKRYVYNGKNAKN